jgi:hypothetical protein
MKHWTAFLVATNASGMATWWSSPVPFRSHLAMDYTYDVFISYRRQRNKSEWLIEHFLPLFEEYLSDSIILTCGRRPRKLFFDQTDVNPNLRQFEQRLGGIDVGANWRLALRNAIKLSCCMLGVWSPGYFLSEWCCVEWNSFARRQQLDTRVIVPISVHDGQSFPQAARDMNYLDLSSYMIVGEGFRKSEKYVTFQETLKNLADSVAHAVKSAPTFADWPVDETVAVDVPKPIELPSFAHGSK